MTVFLLIGCFSFILPAQAQEEEEEVNEFMELVEIEDLEDAPLMEGEMMEETPESDIRTLNGRFYLRIDSNLDGTLSESQNLRSFPIILRDLDGTIFGNYERMNNDSEFSGTVVQSSRVFGLRLITIRQFDQGYQAMFTGIWNEGKITGTYYNVAGSSGDFELIER